MQPAFTRPASVPDVASPSAKSLDPNGIGTPPDGVDPGDIYLANRATYDFITFQVTTCAPGAAAAPGVVGAASLRGRRR